MGPADEVTSHLYSFGIRGKQFQYIEGKLPEGFPFHGRLTDHDVRNLQGRGAEVIVLEPHYTSQELMQARADCRGETGATPNQAEVKPERSQTPTAANTLLTPASMPTSDPQPSQKAGLQPAAGPLSKSAFEATLAIDTTPPGADIELDGRFVGNTPRRLKLPLENTRSS